MDIEEMKRNGTFNYYIELKKFIREYIDRNFPLSREDMQSIMNDSPTQNVLMRQRLNRILNYELEKVLEDIAKRNKEKPNNDNDRELSKGELLELKQRIQDVLSKPKLPRSRDEGEER